MLNRKALDKKKSEHHSSVFKSSSDLIDLFALIDQRGKATLKSSPQHTTSKHPQQPEYATVRAKSPQPVYLCVCVCVCVCV